MMPKVFSGHAFCGLFGVLQFYVVYASFCMFHAFSLVVLAPKQNISYAKCLKNVQNNTFFGKGAQLSLRAVNQNHIGRLLRTIPEMPAPKQTLGIMSPAHN